MKFTDAATLSGARRTGDGYLVAEAFAVRTGVQVYSGAEMGVEDRETIAVYRPEEEVRSADSLRTFSHAPVTMGHPAENVTTDNWRELAVGEVSTEASWHDGKIKLPLILKDAAAIAAVEAGTRELSAGYTCTIEMQDGVAPDGTPYQAVQRNIRINHLAVVPRGRAGSEFRIGDEAGSWGAAPITTSKKEDKMSDALKTVVLGDKAVQVAAADHAAIEAFKADMAKKLTDAETAKDKAEGERDAAVTAKDTAEAKVLDAAAIDKLVADRAELVGKANAIAPDVATTGLADAEIRKAVVVAKLGDAMKDKPAAYIDARFDILAEDAKPVDPVRGLVADGLKVVANDGWDAAAASAGINLKKGA